MPPPSSASHGLPSEILEMLGRVQDQAMIFSFTVDENNENARFPYASPGAQAVYGVSAEEVMSDAMELVGRIHDDDQRSYFSSVEESWKQLSEWNFTWRSRFPGYPNNYKWLKASSMPKRLPNGHTIWYGAVYDADAETRLGDSEKRQTESAASNRLLQSENDSISNKYAHAFDLLNDVVFAVRATSWEAADWRVYESSKSFGEYFQLGGEKRFLDTVDDGAVLRELLAAARHEMQPIRDLAVFKPTHSSNERTLRCRAVDLSGVEGFTSVLVVCHDLTDFKFRIEAEKDRQVAAKLQHEDKNLHKSHEVSASYTLEQLGIIEKQLAAHRDAAAQFQSPELKKVWLDLEAVREHSFEAIRQAKATLATMQTRSKRAQEDAHLRIMIFQMAAQEYVPLSLPVDVVASVVAEFGADAGVCVRAFEVPEVQLDWHLLRYALENAVSNARKYGTDMEIELAIEYHEPTLVMQVSNAADPQKQAQLIARHGTNATRLLHHRGNTGGAHSTNLGGQAMRDVARLLRGSVSRSVLADDGCDASLAASTDDGAAVEISVSSGWPRRLTRWAASRSPSASTRGSISSASQAPARSMAGSSSYGGTPWSTPSLSRSIFVLPPSPKTVKSTVTMVVATTVAPFRLSSISSCICTASATAMAPRRPECAITAWKRKGRGRGRQRLTIAERRKTCRTRPARQARMVTPASLKSMLSTYRTRARPTSRKMSVSQNTAMLLSTKPRWRRAMADRFGAA
mmetsp:Transcript_27988/g.92056  ORF Transcript_27988/g.92056 Transcript_27988/m.92056 type:complete len:743 (+) Transcript_27988:60-2288(+)